MVKYGPLKYMVDAHGHINQLRTKLLYKNVHLMCGPHFTVAHPITM